MSVSRALRNQPKVSPAVRARVLEMADRIGYRPDPEISKLMVHLRTRRKLAFQGLICALSNRSVRGNQSYFSQIVEGARQCAESRGFGFSLVQFELGQHRSLQRVLKARDVQGALILPLQQPADLVPLLNWPDLSVVSATSSLLAPLIHRVTPNHLANTLRLCDELLARGYRRVGLVTDVQHDLRVNHAFTAAVTWHGMYAGAGFVEPLIQEAGDEGQLKSWFRRNKPDAIVSRDNGEARRIARLLQLEMPGPVGFACTSTDPASGISGIDEIPSQIGAAAIDMLSGMMQHRERGIPPAPRTLSLHGRWVDGATCPVRPQPGR